MLKSIRDFFIFLLDSIVPRRGDFELVKSLDEESIQTLPRSGPVENMNWVHPLFQYRNRTVRAIIWELKYKETTLPLGPIGKMMYEEIVDAISDIILFDSDAKFLLIPIPITPESRAERGFNQSEYVAKAILENDLGHHLLYAPQWFEKVKETHRQSHSKNRLERISNLKDCFHADPRVENYYVILIDDVVTTGSTLEEAKKTLVAAGARNVLAWTIAH